MTPLEILFKVIKALQSDTSPNQLAAGFMIGMMMGLTPLLNLQGALLIFLLFSLKINISMAFLGFGVFSGFAFLFDTYVHDFGYYLLSLDSLKTVWTQMYNHSVWSLTNFNNTVTLGSVLISILLALPVFFGGKLFVVKYREIFQERAEKWKLVKILKGSKIYELYRKFGG